MVIDRKQDMFFVLLEQTPSERQRVQRTLSSLSMKRWRTDDAAERCLVAAALAVALVTGWANAVRAESPAMPAPTFSRAALDRIGDDIRNRSHDRQDSRRNPADPAARQAGLFRMFGVRDPETGQPMTPDSIFQIYSMSKAVTSVAAMMLVDDGQACPSMIPYRNTFVPLRMQKSASIFPMKQENIRSSSSR